MTILRFGDNSDFTVHFKEGDNGLWHYIIRGADERARLIPPVAGPKHGFVTEEEARAIVEKLYLSTLSRRPVPGEMDVAMGALGADLAQGAENLQWALLNKPEFLFNY